MEIVGWEYWDRLGYKEVIEISEVHVGEEVISFSGERMGGGVWRGNNIVEGWKSGWLVGSKRESRIIIHVILHFCIKMKV